MFSGLFQRWEFSTKAACSTSVCVSIPIIYPYQGPVSRRRSQVWAHLRTLSSSVWARLPWGGRCARALGPSLGTTFALFPGEMTRAQAAQGF